MIRSLLIASLSIATLAACAAPDDSGPATSSEAIESPEGNEARALMALVDECSAGAPARSVTDLCVLSHDAMEGRLVGTPGNALAREYIISRFQQIGLAPLGDSFEHPFSFQRRIDFRNPGSPRETIHAVNLIARIPGADSSKVMAITAHFDHVGPGENNEIYNGADDNASGVAGLLAVAEHFMMNPPAHDVLIIAFDAEEGGLSGARHFVDNRPDGIGEVVFNLNLDMLGYSPDGDIWAAGSYHTPGLLPIIEAAADRASVTLKAGYDYPTGDPREDWTLLSDHGPFHMAGIAFLYIGVEDHEHYHQPSDEFGIIDLAFFSGVVDLVVDVAGRADAALSEIAVMERRGEDE